MSAKPKTLAFSFFLGATLLLVPILASVLHGNMEVWLPSPLPVVLSFWIMGWSSIAILPATYLLLTWLAGDRTFFPRAVVALNFLVLILNSWFLQASWKYGVAYQGEAHTKAVATLSSVVLLSSFALALAGWLRGSRRLTLASNWFCFLALAWCAFPYLGETP